MLVEPSDLARRGRDRALIEAHCAGDEAAFPVIVGAHYRALLTQAHRRLGSRVEAEDAVQETFERAYRGLCRVNGEYRIGAWLSRILANVCTDHAARREVQRSLPERIGPRQTTAPDISEHASDPFVLRAVQDALDSLPATQRQTFWLYEMDGLTYPEVAQQLGISEDNARARVHRAKATLRRSLARVRDAVAGVIAIPLGLRALTREGKKLAAPLPAGGPSGPPAVGVGAELAPGVSASATGLQASAAHVAYAVTGPVADLAASTASSGGARTIAVLAAGLAAAVGGIVGVPAVTGSSGSSSAPASVSVATPSEAPAPVDTGSEAATTSIVVPTVESSVSTITPPSTLAITPEVDWVSAAMEADDAPRGSVGASGPGPSAQPGAAPAADPCPWLKAYPDVLASLPGKAPVIGTLDPAKGPAGSGVSLTLSAATTLRIAADAGGPTTTEVPVTLRAQVCLEPGESAIVADLEGADGQRVQLRGALVMRLNDQVFLFRG